MDRLSEYIPFLLAIGFIILSITKGKKGKAKEEDTARTTLPGRKAGEEIRPVVPNFPKSTEAMKVNSSQPAKIEYPTSPKITQPSKPVISNTPFIFEFEESDSDSSSLLNINDPEKIKQAIIYSEIINKKDFF